MTIPKKLILDACLQKQNDLIDSFRKQLEGMETDAFAQNHSPSQSENRAAGKIELLNAVGKELDFALREMELLKMLNPDKESSIVEPGAVVVSDKLTFYICVSIEKIEVQGQPIFGISTKAPIYASMRGLKKGDSFSFNETDYIIKEVY
jgi:sorbitol-specific phosphotransferase system component IIA